ncbi:hypothetical protein NSA56_09180 [Oceanobacillus caeni]|nr:MULTISPECIES: hypothetical protein [Bacillaceae]MCR1834570.1 hypothetical protein [Oceanobacillus caeni]MED4474992.1 hypothetical protein [Oceanobacillus caeni]
MRNTFELPPIAAYLKDSIQTYFKKQGFSIYPDNKYDYFIKH